MSRLISFALGSLLCLSVYAEPSVRELEAVVGEWVKLKREGIDEARRWEEERAGYQRERALIDTQTRNLEHRLAELKKVLAAQEAPRDRADRMKQLAARLTAVETEVTQAALVLEAYRKRVPKPLADTLPQPVPASGKVSAKLQRLLALHAAFSDLHNRIHVTHEMLPVGDGKDRLFDVIYLGMARGFAVSADDALALVGTPGPEGWHWEKRADGAEAVRSLHQIQSGERPPAYISLDVKR